MSLHKILAISSALLVISACKYNDAELNYDELHKYCSEEWKPDLGGKPADLSVVGPKCSAAKGLSGDAIVCVDFDKVSGLSDQALTGWDFTTNCGAGWQIAGGKLQVKNFGSFVGTCSFMMPLVDLGALGNQKYSSVTLAVVQRVDLNPSASPAQTAQTMLGLDVSTREFATATGSNPAQQNVHVLSRTVIQTMTGGTNFQPLFKLTSGAAHPTGTGWQIESIAVMGNL
jgi:hypothetical protein